MKTHRPIQIIQYDEHSITEDILEALQKRGSNNVWLRIISMANMAFLDEVIKHFGIHELTLEDITSPEHPTKVEQTEDYTLLIMKRIYEEDGYVETIQFSIIFGEGFLITFGQAGNIDVSTYIRSMHGKALSVEQVVYQLIDQLIDSYLDYANNYQNKTDDIEDLVLESSGAFSLSALFEFKQSMHQFRRVVRPARDLVEFLLRPKSAIFSEEMYPYLKDLADHARRVVSLAENIEETLTSLHSIILTQFQYKLSRTMNLMTAVSVIFLPLMVITGIYGMNFEHMPELAWKYAYPMVLGVMAVIGITMFVFFVKRKMI
ncbi:MAG: hypothetical protein LBV04_07625 [Deferribacteraceae bacterium]|jgi:magnesium transporter|nr:hypothetical protein [Deferribacteraceae bacterium]